MCIILSSIFSCLVFLGEKVENMDLWLLLDV